MIRKTILCATLTLALAACGKKKDDAGGGTGTAAGTGSAAAGSGTAAGTASTGTPAPSAGKVDPEIEAAIRAVVAGCKIDEKGWAKDCKDGEHDKAKKLIGDKTAIASIESVSVLANDPDDATRRYVAGLSYDTISSHIGVPYFYKDAKANPKAITADIALRLIGALDKVEGQARFYLAPAAIHAALLTDNVPALEAALKKADDKGLWHTFHTNLMVFPRLAHFDRIKALADEGVKADDGQQIITAIDATQALPAPTDEERQQICPWAAGFITSANLDVAAQAAHSMIQCGGEYIDKLQAEGEARVAAGTFANPLSMAFRDICFTPVAGTSVAGADEQCAKNFAFLEAVGQNKDLDGKVRGQALWNIYYQRRDRTTLDLLRKYQNDKDPEVALQVRDAIKSLVESYKIDDGKGVPPEPTTWKTNATEHKDEVGKTFSYTCPPDGKPGSIYGTKIYTHDSSICTAAVHMGKIKLEKGGKVKIVIKPGQDKYEASEKNGISSRSYGSYPASFQFK